MRNDAVNDPKQLLEKAYILLSSVASSYEENMKGFSAKNNTQEYKHVYEARLDIF